MILSFLHIPSEAVQVGILSASSSAGSNAPNWAVIASCIAAWLALCISIANTAISYRGYRLNKDKDDRLRANIKVEYDSGHYETNSDSGDRVYKFFVTILNLSDANTSVKSADMSILYKAKKNGVSSTFKVRLMVPEGEARSSSAEISVPIKIEAKQAVSGWLQFKVSSNFLSRSHIDRYIVSVEDGLSNKYNFEPIVLFEKRHNN